MKIITTMKIVEIPGADLIEEDDSRILIHFHGGEFPATYTLESLTIFRDALTAMINHLSGETEPAIPNLGPATVKDEDGATWHRHSNGKYSLKREEMPPADRPASWSIAEIREVYGIAEDQS